MEQLPLEVDETSAGYFFLLQPLRPPGAAVPPANLSAAPASASSGEAGAAPAPAPNLIDFDLSPQPPAAAQATENPFAPVNASDISVQLASMSKWSLLLCHFVFHCRMH